MLADPEPNLETGSSRMATSRSACMHAVVAAASRLADATALRLQDLAG